MRRLPPQEQITPPSEQPVPTFRNRRVLLIGLVVLLAVAGAALVASRVRGVDTATDDTTGFATQRVEGGNVTVAVTWGGSSADPIFDITLDTHSVDLDRIDLSQLAVLRVDGLEVQPVSWDAPKGSHHRAGTLTFPATAPDGDALIHLGTTTVELVIRDVAGVPERVFQWNP